MCVTKQSLITSRTSTLQAFLDFRHQIAERHIQTVGKHLAQPNGRQPQTCFYCDNSGSPDARQSRQLLLRKASILARFLEDGGKSFGKSF